MGTRSKGQKRPESRSRPSVGMSFRLAIPWPVALQQSRPPLRQLCASFNQGYLGVEKFSVNGTLSLNCLSHLRGQVHGIAKTEAEGQVEEFRKAYESEYQKSKSKTP